MKLWGLHHSFQSWVLRVSEEGAAKPSEQNPCLPFKAYSASSWTKLQSTGQRSVTTRKLTQLHFCTKHHKSDHLTLDILTPATEGDARAARFFRTARVALPLSSHRGEVPSRGVWGGCCAPAGETHLGLPLSKRAGGREGGEAGCCCSRWTTEDYCSYRRTMSHSNMTQSWRFSHSSK